MTGSEMELPRSLSAKFKDDFAYPTIKDRLPVILTKTVDSLCRSISNVQEKHGETGVEDMKSMIGALSKLRSEVQTDKPVIPITGDFDDVDLWNTYIKQHVDADKDSIKGPSWFTSAWLYVECYMYRRVWEAVTHSKLLKTYDIFGEQKQEGFNMSLKAMETYAEYLVNTIKCLDSDNSTKLRDIYGRIIGVALWGNKCDLSISGGKDNSQTSDALSQLDDFKEFLLSDQTQEVWQTLINAKKSNMEKVRVDIVLDNAGFELFSDLCHAEFLMSSGLVNTVHFHAKTMPWFVSDVTAQDWQWSLDQLVAHDSKVLSDLGKKWKQRIAEKTWVFNTHKFWTLPQDFSEMKSTCPELYEELSQADLIFFKGDLNYRKLTCDRKWDPTTAFEVALCGFHPAPLCTLRTLKADIVVGLHPGQAQECQQKQQNWMISGDFGVIQYCSKKVS